MATDRFLRFPRPLSPDGSILRDGNSGQRTSMYQCVAFNGYAKNDLFRESTVGERPRVEASGTLHIAMGRTAALRSLLATGSPESQPLRESV